MQVEGDHVAEQIREGVEKALPFPYRFPTNKAGPLSFASMCALNVPLSVACVIKLSATDLTGKRT